MLSNQLNQNNVQSQRLFEYTFVTRTRSPQGVISAGVQHSRARCPKIQPLRPACLDSRHSCCTSLSSSYYRHRLTHSSSSSSTSKGANSHQAVEQSHHTFATSPGSSTNSNRKPTAFADVRTAAAAAAACPFPDDPHLQHHQGHWGSSSSSSAAGSGFTAEQLHPDVHQQFLGLGFRHSVEEAFKAFVHVPSSSRQQHDAPQQQQQQAGQQTESSCACDYTSTAAQHDHSSCIAAASAVSSSSPTSASAGSAAHLLTWQIKNCKTAAAVEALLQEHWRTLDHIHVSAAFVQLARLQRSSSSSSGVSPAGMQWLLQLAAHHLPQMHSRHISNVLWACASLHLTPSEPWLKGFTDKARTLFQKGTTPQGFANIIWAVAVLQAPVSRNWIKQFLTASQPHLFNFQPQELSSTIWALARMTVQPPQDWQYSFIVASTAKMASFNAQSLSNQLWAVAKLNLIMPQQWMAAVTYSAQIHAHDFPPLGLSNLLWGAAKLAGRSQQQQQQQQQQQVTMQQQQVLGAVASSSSAQWIQPLLAAAVPKLQQYNAHTLSNVIWSLAVLDHKCSPEFLDHCFQELLSKVDRLTPAGAAAALWGFSKLGMLPSPQQLALLLQQVQLLLPHNNAQQLIYIAAALALYKKQQQQQQQQVHSDQCSGNAMIPDVFVQQYLAVCSLQLQQQLMTPPQACQLGHWLAAAAVHPEPQWTDNYLLYLAQRLPQLNPNHHVTILQTLSAWGHKPHEGWAAMFMAAATAQQRVATYSAEHVGTLLQGFVAAALQPQQQQVDLLLQQVVSPASQVSAAAAAAVLRGICGLGCRPDDQWLTRFWEVGQSGLSGSDAASLTSLAVALQLPELGQLQIRPSKLWGFAYHAAVAAVLNPSSSSETAGLKPQQAAAVLTALAAVQRGPQQQQQSLLPDLMAAAAAGDGLSLLELDELVGALWALVYFGVLPQPVPLTRIHHHQQQQQPLVSGLQQTRQQMELQRPQQVSASDLHQQRQQQQVGLQQHQHQQHQWDAEQWQVHWLQHLFLRPDAESGLSELGIHSLLKLASTLARLQQPTPGSWAGSFSASMSVHVPHLAPHQLVTVLCAVPCLGGYAAQPALTDQILAALQPVLGELTSKQLSEVVTTAQRSGAQPSEAWLSDFVAAAQARLPSFLCRQIIEVLGSLARLRFIPPAEFIDTAADLAVEKSGSFAGPALLVDLIWALTALRVNPSAAWMARFEARMLAKGPERLDAASISRFGWCLGALQRKPGQLLMAKYLAAAQQQHCNMSATSLADCLWACAMLDERPSKPWLESFLIESRKRLPTFPSSALVTVIWSLALLQCRPPSDWMDRCLAATMACLSNTYEAAMAATAAVAPRAAASSNIGGVHLLQRPQLPGSTTPAAATAVPPHLAPLTPSQITDLVWSLAALDCRLPDQMLRLVIWKAERVISAVSSDDLAQLVWALDRLDDTSDKFWVRGFAASARAQLLAAMSSSLNHGSGLSAPMPQRGVASSAAVAAAGFKQLHGVSSMGQVVLIKPKKEAAGAGAGAGDGAQQQQHSGSLAALVAAKGLIKTRLSKQELYAKLLQFQQQQQQHNEGK